MNGVVSVSLGFKLFQGQDDRATSQETENKYFI